MDEKTYRLTEKGRTQRVWAKLKFDLVFAFIISGLVIFAWIKGGKNPQATLMLYALPIGVIIPIAYRLWEYSGDAKKWQLILTAESITLDCGERKGSFIKEGPLPVVFQKTEIGEIIETERSVQIVNQSRTAVIEFPKEIESYEELRSVLEQWNSIPKDPPPVVDPATIPIRGMVIKYAVLITGSIAALWLFNHPAVIFPAGLFSLFAGFVMISTGWWPFRCVGVVIMLSTAYRFFHWFGS